MTSSPTWIRRWLKSDFAMERFVSFTVAGRTIRGVLHLPEAGNAEYPGVVLCHGFTGNKIGLHRIFVKAARFFCQAGYAVLRFDFSGCGDSDGDHGEITINGQVVETLAALGFLKNMPQIKSDEMYLVGLSMGGAVAALAAARVSDLAGLVLLAPVADMYEDIRGIVGEELFAGAMANGIADYMGFALSSAFIESLQKNSPLAAAASFNGPLLVIHGTGDEDIPYQNAGRYQEVREGLPYATGVHLLPGADHTFSALRWENEVFEVTTGWLKDHAGKLPHRAQYPLLTG